MEQIKICSKCKRELKLDMFQNHKKNKDGKSYMCKFCISMHKREYRLNNPEIIEKERIRSRQWRKKNKEYKRKKDKEYQEKNRDRILAQKREYGKEYRKRPEAIIYMNKYCEDNKDGLKKQKKKYRQAHKKEAQNASLLWNYNLTLEEYNKMLEEQKGVCYICGGVNKNGKNLFVDHNHSNGHIRRLLCMKCNIVLGIFEENIQLIENAISYLEKYNEN